MKQLLIALLFSLLFFTQSCKKDRKEDHTLPGTWEWVLTTGTVVGNETPASTGKQLRYIFRADNTFTQIINSATWYGTYATGTDSATKLQFINMGANSIYFFFYAHDTLIFTDYSINGELFFVKR